MDNIITYLNTDLDLTSDADLTDLVETLKIGGLWSLQATLGDDGLWYAAFESEELYSDPETSIAAMLTIIESLPTPMRSLWDGCSRREFNIGYDCGAEPWAFNQGLSRPLLERMTSARASLRITLYPDRSDRESS